MIKVRQITLFILILRSIVHLINMTDLIISTVAAFIIGFLIIRYIKHRITIIAASENKEHSGVFTKKAQEIIAQKKKLEKQTKEQ